MKKLLEFLTVSIKNLRKVYYFTDGASSQYKNRKNFVNLAFHMWDSNLEAEWHFFATSHGKGPCDGLGGPIKREAVRASLQRPLEGQIQTAFQLYEWAKEAIPSIQFQYVDKGEYEAEEHLLQKRLEAAVTIVGTHSFYSYSPLIDKTSVLEVKPYSYCPKSTTVKISTHRELLSMAELSGYVICE